MRWLRNRAEAERKYGQRGKEEIHRKTTVYMPEPSRGAAISRDSRGAFTISCVGEKLKSMELALTANEVRVLGSLVEKDITTPEYYPLSLNALVNACNQKSNRDPVMQLDEDAVRDAIDGLHSQRMAGPAGGADSRVTKYEHRLQEVFNFTRAETAVLCVLLLRGPQTPGELRGRTERLHRFETLDDVQSALQKLMQRDPVLVKVLPRQPGTKESRWVHLMSGDVAVAESMHQPIAATEGGAEAGERVARLEEEVATLRRELGEIKDQMERFRKQFE
jgi:uncharacterized protein YceH (UPF0502 family)